MNDNYENMGTGELRKLIREKGIGSGLALSGANKETCIKLLRGELSWESFKAGSGADFSASQGASTCQHQQGEAAAPAVDGGNAAAMLGQALAALMPKTVDMEEVRRLAVNVGHDAAVNAFTPILEQMNEKIASLSAPVRVIVENREKAETKDLGVVHKSMPALLAMCQSRMADGFVPNIYLYGPAGTGKTTAAKQVAKALGLEYYFNGAIDCEYKLSGFIDASGTFRSRPFYEAYSKGGVYLFDELDSSMPGAVMAFNSALANGYADFPVGRVQRHKDCVILAAGNTDMRGAKDGFGARNKMDAAFRDRFVFLNWEIDNALEKSIADAYGDEWGWLADIRRWRRNAKSAGIKDFEITPRATGAGLAMLRAGVDRALVVNACARKGIRDDIWAKVEG